MFIREIVISETDQSEHSITRHRTILTNHTAETDMTLELPKHNHEYKDPDYWNQRFKQEEAYEWLLEYCHVKQETAMIYI